MVPETSKIIGPFAGHRQLIDNIKAHYKAAGYEEPNELFARIEAYICEQEKEYCGEQVQPVWSIGKVLSATYHTFHAAHQCIATLTSHRAGSGERPSQELQEQRAQICVACPQNTDIEPCSVCSVKTLQRAIEKLAGAKKTTVHDKLKFCGVCHCANTAKVATKLEAIWNHMPERQRKALPKTCWIAIEQAEQETKYTQ